MLVTKPKPGARIVVAMSGGVDSSVAAGYLKQQGYDVIGISLQLHDMASEVENKYGTCCSLTDIGDARRVADRLDIPFYVANMENQFKQSVIDDFVQEYLAGRTPNPCVKCNEKVKFRQLMDWAMDLGAEYLATGHYATTRVNLTSGETELCKGADPGKDQSYFLFTMRQDDLAKTIFPVGHFKKDEVRAMAVDMKLAVAGKPDSQEICFVQAKSYKTFIEESVPAELRKPGPMVDLEGKVIGEHTGLYQFTIGQRKGIGVASLEPQFVIALDAKRDAVVVGPESALFRRYASVAGVTWVNRETPSENLAAKIRYRAKESPVRIIESLGNELRVEFLEPQRAITPGQAIVFYENDRVLGGGWITDFPMSSAVAAS